MAKFIAQFYSEFFCSDLNKVGLTTVVVDGEKMYQIIEKTKDGKRIRTPFIVSRKIFEEKDITEIIGLTWNLMDRCFSKDEVKYEYHPMMETACERYSKELDNSVVVCRISASLRKGKCSCDMPLVALRVIAKVEDDFFLNVLFNNL
jgi:hypothetical protein